MGNHPEHHHQSIQATRAKLRDVLCKKKAAQATAFPNSLVSSETPSQKKANNWLSRREAFLDPARCSGSYAWHARCVACWLQDVSLILAVISLGPPVVRFYKLFSGRVALLKRLQQKSGYTSSNLSNLEDLAVAGFPSSLYFRRYRKLAMWLWLKKPVPKWNLGKWTHGPKPA